MRPLLATRSLGLGLLVLAAGLAPVAGSAAPASASCAKELAAAEAPRPYWVFFIDHGTVQAPDDLLARARAITPEAWARRARAGARLPDVYDRPVWEPYVQAVAEHGQLRHRSRWLNAVSVTLTAEAIAKVRALPSVAGVRPVAIAGCASLGPARDAEGRPLEVSTRVRRGRSPATPAAQLRYGEPAPLPPSLTVPGQAGSERALDYGPSLFQLDEIGVPPLHALGYSGNRVRLMMLDTGFRKDHDAFAAADRLAEWDFVFEDGDVQNEPEDLDWQHNHGTGCWGSAGGYAPGFLIGPGYGATFVLAKTEDVGSETQAEEDNYVAALEWADSLGVTVTSASLSYVCFDDSSCYTFEDKDGDTAVISIAVDIAASRGILCVNAQGNYGCAEGSLGTPADADSMVAVGAVDSLNVIASFSACGPTYDGRIKPEIVARGVDTWWVDAREPDAYGQASGTSLSAPLVGGTVALLLEAHPEWGPMDLRAALLATADRTLFPDNTYGWGRIDAASALNHTPVLYPRPFSLLAPGDSAVSSEYRPTFTWRATEDPDQGDPIAYTLWLTDLESNEQWSVTAGADTTRLLPFPLTPERGYRWEITAEDLAGHRRTSRETHVFFLTPPASGVEPGAGEGESPSPTALPPRLTIEAHPNPFVASLEVSIAIAEGRPAGEAGPPTWAVYDPLGRRIAHGAARASGGAYRASWDGRTRGGTPAGAGVYYLEVRLGSRAAREMIVKLDR